jgi:hypothetical protein
MTSQTPESAPILAEIIFAPKPYTKTRPTIFLSGSIDALPATWQSKITTSLSHLSITILNPHRPDWDSSWKESPDDPKFSEQTKWELDGMENADVMVAYFGENAKAPISLLELGLFARSGKVVVGCPKGYWKSGNVRMVCERFELKCVESVEELGIEVMRMLEDLKEKK